MAGPCDLPDAGEAYMRRWLPRAADGACSRSGACSDALAAPCAHASCLTRCCSVAVGLLQVAPQGPVGVSGSCAGFSYR
jgi:hypothetical protein